MRRTLPIVSGLVVALACVAIAPARPAPAAEPGSVRIVEPRPRTTVLGRAQWVGQRVKRLATTVCGQRSAFVRVTPSGTAGRIRVSVTKP